MCASAALACWSVGDLYYQAWVAGAEDQPFPSPADAVWLCFYPFVYATLALLVRGRGRRFELTTWLDGLIGALSVAAVTAAVVFDPLVALTGGDAATVTTNLAYPIGDLLLLGFVVGAFILHGWRGNRPLVLLGIGLAAAAIADTAFLLGTATGTWTDGSIARRRLAAGRDARRRGRLARAGRPAPPRARRRGGPARPRADGHLRRAGRRRAAA